MKKTGLLFIGFFIFSVATAQFKGGTIRGTVKDTKTKQTIEYATIAVYKADNSLLTGGVTNEKGRFEISGLPEGVFSIIINFIGYNQKKIEKIVVNKQNTVAEVGTIFLNMQTQTIDEVVVQSSKHQVEYQIDKKIVSVSKELNTASATAVEVLENIPSVSVDIEGNVSLRGSSGFTVLIDGKPTLLDPNEVLQQTPASTIENIEIITNPSVKYAPDGTGGIINIITKKNRALGLQGLIHLNTGNFGQYGGDFLLNYRVKKVNLFVGGNYGVYKMPVESYSERKVLLNDTLKKMISKGDYQRMRTENDWRVGVSWDITEKDNFTLEGNIGLFGMDREANSDYVSTIEKTDFEKKEYNQSQFSRKSKYYSVNANYSHKFEREKHELQFMGSYAYRDAEEFSNNFLQFDLGKINEGTRIEEDGPLRRIETKLDYSLPIKKGLFEAGLQYRNSQSTDFVKNYTYDTNQSEFILNSEYNKDITYDDKTASIYSLYQGKHKRLGYQLGVRAEYTFREIIPLKTDKKHKFDDWDFFPTAHFSYQINEKNQLMASYSRRIDRPRPWYLEPFVTKTDIFNVRSGNPDLVPEYINAMELGYVKQWEKAQFSLEAYYRIKENKIERIQSVYEKDILLTTFKNVGTDYSLGIESMFSVPLFKWWNFSLSGNVYNYVLKSEKKGIPYQVESLTWSSRVSNIFSLYKNIKLQVDGSYRSPSVSSQGRTEPNYGVNASLRADFFERKLSATLQVRNIFGTSKYTSITEQNDFYNYRSMKPQSPAIRLSLSYRLNNFKNKRNAEKGLEREQGGEDFE